MNALEDHRLDIAGEQRREIGDLLRTHRVFLPRLVGRLIVPSAHHAHQVGLTGRKKDFAVPKARDRFRRFLDTAALDSRLFRCFTIPVLNLDH